MGIEDLVVDSADSYVRQAVRLANDEPYRRETQQRIVNAAACLFEDPDEVRVLEDFLWSVSE
jgi:predicted O-linked N-acetylglucosamine transferase (SPINDLY family)